MPWVYIHESVYEDLCAELTRIAGSVKLGNGAEAGVDLGPLQNKAQYEKVKSLLEDTHNKGRIIAGGKVLERKGYFIEPTLACELQSNARIIDEEQFGPILPIVKFSDPEAALHEINQSKYGLGGSVWSKDIDEARTYALQMEAGTVWINKHPEIDPAIPLGGAKHSGFGMELGYEGLNEYTQKKVINIAR